MPKHWTLFLISSTTSWKYSSSSHYFFGSIKTWNNLYSGYHIIVCSVSNYPCLSKKLHSTPSILHILLITSNQSSWNSSGNINAYKISSVYSEISRIFKSSSYYCSENTNSKKTPADLGIPELRLFNKCNSETLQRADIIPEILVWYFPKNASSVHLSAPIKMLLKPKRVDSK